MISLRANSSKIFFWKNCVTLRIYSKLFGLLKWMEIGTFTLLPTLLTTTNSVCHFWQKNLPNNPNVVDNWTIVDFQILFDFKCKWIQLGKGRLNNLLSIPVEISQKSSKLQLYNTLKFKIMKFPNTQHKMFFIWISLNVSLRSI